MLRSLHMKDVGPARSLDLELGERLNVLTGDNGLGKSIVLDVAWWALTGTWAGRPLWARRVPEETPTLEWDLEGEGGASVRQMSSLRVDQVWERSAPVAGRAGLVVYARANNTFAVWDSARSYQTVRTRAPEIYSFDTRELWYGLDGGDKRVCNGLLQDWVTWQLEADAGQPGAFALLSEVLRALSHPGEEMKPGRPERLFLGDSRNYPVIELPYGKVPAIHVSAGMQRILGLAYLIAWSWTEHLAACRLLGWEPPQRFAFFLDEPEAHLHPKWQRHILPALLEVLRGLLPGARPQVLLTTHSPLVLASLEPGFDRDTDKLFLFELRDGDVSLAEYPWTKFGDAVGWLTSEIFAMEQARSVEAEHAIRAAYDFMAGRRAELPRGLRTEKAIDRELTRVLPAHDPFWVQWIVAARRRKEA
jgi:hypothetical protein